MYVYVYIYIYIYIHIYIYIVDQQMAPRGLKYDFEMFPPKRP